jgi:hypothetical protein
MPRRTLIEVREDDFDWQIDTLTGDENEDNGWWDEQRPLGELATLEHFADYCDRKAEARNNHEYTGAHRVLAALLHQQLGRDGATHLLHLIAEYGGLDRMVGVGEITNDFAELGIPEGDVEWQLADTNTSPYVFIPRALVTQILAEIDDDDVRGGGINMLDEYAEQLRRYLRG